jgi:hypothetical protein
VTSNRKGDLERGMQLIPKLSEVMPNQGDERIKPVYESIQRTLRVPFVNFIFRTLANYPDYFEPAWRRLSPVFRTSKFERDADKLRAQALFASVPDASEVDWTALGDLDEIRSFTDSIHYVLPKLLLVATAFEEFLNHSSEERYWRRIESMSSTADIPPGVAKGTTKIEMVNPKKAKGRIKDLFESIKQRHDHPGVASYYRALGNWPEFLEAAWDKIEPLVGSTPYEERKRALVGHAESFVRELLPLGTEAAVEWQAWDPKQTDDIRSVLAVFRFKLIPDLLLDVTLIKAMLDGPDAARFSRLSVAGQATWSDLEPKREELMNEEV